MKGVVAALVLVASVAFAEPYCWTEETGGIACVGAEAWVSEPDPGPFEFQYPEPQRFGFTFEWCRDLWWPMRWWRCGYIWSAS